MKIMNIREIKNLSEDELGDLIEKTIKSVNMHSWNTIYLDLLTNGTYLISVDENPIEVYLNESVALKKFDEITS
jgi:hypothetical protein